MPKQHNHIFRDEVLFSIGQRSFSLLVEAEAEAVVVEAEAEAVDGLAASTSLVVIPQTSKEFITISLETIGLDFNSSTVF